jgi:hypothetical protein
MSGKNDEFELRLDLTPVVEGVRQFMDAMGNALESFAALAQPRPQREVRELRDLARAHNLDHVERGPATIRRDDGVLVAEWSGEELTRFSEYGGGRDA